MESAHIIYTTDVNHSYASRDIIAVTSGRHRAIKLVIDHAINNGSKLSDDDIDNLMRINQTQGFEGDCAGEYVIEEVVLNTLL